MINTRAIHIRLILWYSGLIVLVSLAFGAFVYHGVQERLYGEMEQTLTRRAEQIAANMLPHLHDKPPHTMAAQITDVYSPEASGSFIRILRGDHSVVYVSGMPKDRLFYPAKVSLPVGRIAGRRMEQLGPDLVMMIVTVPAKLHGQTYYIQMGGLTHGIRSALDELITMLLFGLPVAAVIASVGGYVLVRRLLQPVEDIRATAEKITFGNLSSRLPVAPTGDALEHLSLTLNQMLARLEDAYEQARRFSADASHELRTPLAILRGELESILREPGLSEHFRERVGSVLEETESLSRITEKLFALSR
ncbi:MAG: HAMP domain-containing protein, partial [Pseudomonadota bacterium]|nr:HAMP domain-containing protein [Pseudomonadota bacterium]